MIPYVFRPIRLSDLGDLKALTATMTDSIASLPDNKDLLKKRIKLSEKSFAQKVSKPAKEYYFFALENVLLNKIIGVSAIEARIGGRHYFYAYELQKESFVHTPLKISKKIDVLCLTTIKKGASELCSLYLDPQYRVYGLGTFLSLARYVFIYAFPKRFNHEIIANLRGYRDENKVSPFWQAIGDTFFGGSLATVDMMKSFGHETFIRDLMPRHPIYVPLLPLKAQAAIGEVHPKTKPALHLLEKQGFKTGKWIDIFDAGPYAVAKREDIKLMKNIREGIVGKVNKPANENTAATFLIANNSLNFRACMGKVTRRSDGTLAVNEDLAQALNITEGLSISYAKI